MVMIEITKNFFLLLVYLIVSLALAFLFKKQSKAILWTSGLLLFCTTLVLFGLGIIQVVKEDVFQVANFVTILMMLVYAGIIILVATDAIKIGSKAKASNVDKSSKSNQEENAKSDTPDYLPTICKIGRAPEILQKAIDAGLIKVEADHYHWTEKKVLLAYLCGRIFCGDEAICDKSTGDRTWYPGKKKMFPEKDLNRLFNVSELKQSRNNRLHLSAPKESEIIDELFKQS